MKSQFTKDRGMYRILITPGEDQRENRQYFEVRFVGGSEIIWVKSARVAFNNSVQRYGRKIHAIVNLETGQLVVGSR